MNINISDVSNIESFVQIESKPCFYYKVWLGYDGLQGNKCPHSEAKVSYKYEINPNYIWVNAPKLYLGGGDSLGSMSLFALLIDQKFSLYFELKL